MATNVERTVGYIYSDILLARLDFHPRVAGRAFFVQELIGAYGLLDSVRVVTPEEATCDMLKTFHLAEYVEYLQGLNSLSSEELDEKYDEAEEFGLGYDCPLFRQLFDFASALGGSTLTAANELNEGKCQVIVNWFGGWHHAKRDEAAGFCYVNDIVLGILELLKKFRKVLYVDLDLHHGDGVEEAFSHSKRVLCFSVHKHGAGFYPGTGDLNDIGFGKGEFYTVNVPLNDGIDDTQYTNIVIPLLQKIQENFVPEVIVCQCGADALAGDPVDAFNLTLKAIGSCITEMLSWNVPLMLLGGGGYDFPNAARLWTYLLSLVVGQELPADIPDHDLLLSYGPDYELHITAKNLPDCNTQDHVKTIMDTILDNLEEVS